jgi:hypothetical protein
MAKKNTPRSFNDVLTLLGNQRFDVAPAPEGAPAGSSAGAPATARSSRAFRVSKYGCAAEIADAPANADAAIFDGSVLLLARPGLVLNGEISRLLDRGYQKFFKTSHVEVPATADNLRALHNFTEEFNQAAGAVSLYNQSLGTTSDSYHYDRVKGRE